MKIQIYARFQHYLALLACIGSITETPGTFLCSQLVSESIQFALSPCYYFLGLICLIRKVAATMHQKTDGPSYGDCMALHGELQNMESTDYRKYSCGSHLLENELFLSRCQVDTPEKIISFFWEIVSSHRSELKNIVDLGAGNGRFAIHSKLKYQSYTGYEIDGRRIGEIPLPENAVIKKRCGFEIDSGDYDLCLGNPPYVRHHDIETDWQEKVSEQLERRLEIRLKRTANLFALFLAQALNITKQDGLVAQIIPYEWVARPSTEPIRELIKKKQMERAHIQVRIRSISPCSYDGVHYGHRQIPKRLFVELQRGWRRPLGETCEASNRVPL